MLWFTVWTVLVLAALAGAAWLGLRLWRQGKALLAEMGRLSEAAEQLSRRTAELDAARGPDPVFRPGLVATDVQRADWRGARAATLQARAGRRSDRHARTLARWRSIGIPL